jgi:HD superfamily phosphohydrolase
MERKYEIRCPIHGFIELNEWEWDIINQPAFQRLRRIRQLGLTDYVYPGATHTRFEHSLGVMHVATRMYDSIVARSREVLETELGYNADGLCRDRMIVRLAALLHDVGHAPLSHAAEEIMPTKPDGTRYKHEDYTAAIIRQELRDVIENHQVNANYNISADDIAQLIEGRYGERANFSRRLIFWRQILASQLDADRMDYLLRDSYHAGVRYGVYDIDRLINCLCAFTVKVEEDEQKIVIGVSEDGWHAAESLILARYYMFTQVYYHKTRRIYDYHIAEAMKSALPRRGLPPPQKMQEYLRYDDWWLLGKINSGKAGPHGQRIRVRDHYRLVESTSETPTIDEISRIKQAAERIRREVTTEVYLDSSESPKSWYNPGGEEILIQRLYEASPVPLHRYSHPVEGMKGIQLYRLYVTLEAREDAKRIVKEVKDG